MSIEEVLLCTLGSSTGSTRCGLSASTQARARSFSTSVLISLSEPPSATYAHHFSLFDLYEKTLDIQVRFRWSPRTSALWDKFSVTSDLRIVLLISHVQPDLDPCCRLRLRGRGASPRHARLVSCGGAVLRSSVQITARGTRSRQAGAFPSRKGGGVLSPGRMHSVAGFHPTCATSCGQ
jgi:hypothetical protein